MAENLGSIYSEIRLKMDNLAGDIAKVKAELATASGMIENMGAEAAGKLKSRMGNVSETIRGVGMAMTGVGVGITGALGAAVKTTADFDKEMAKVRALSGATEEAFQKLRQAAIELGAQSVYSASQAAEGMSILAAAGFNTSQILDAMPGVMNAAAAAGEDFAAVSDIMVAAMSGFGLQAKDMTHIADVLASAANASAISITDLGYTFKYIAPVAHSAGQSLETMAAAAAILGNAGIKADQAGTTLRMALIRLTDPPKEAAQWLEQLGIKTTDASGKMLPLSNIIAQLSEKFQGLTQEQRLQAASAIFGAEAMSGMMALIQAGPDQLSRLTAAFTNSSGAAQKMAEDMNNSLAGAWEQFLGALESMAINIGTQLTPVLRMVTNFVTDIVQAFNALPPSVKQVIAIVAALTAGFLLLAGPALMLVGFLPSIAAGAAMISTAMAGLSAAIGPVIVVIGAVAAAAALLYAAWQTNFGGIRDITMALWNQIQTKFQEAWMVISQTVGGLIDYIKHRWAEIQPALQPVMQWLGTIFGSVFQFIADTVMFYVNNVVSIIQGAINAIAGIIKFFVALLTGDWKGAWEAVKQILNGAVQAIWGLLNSWLVGKVVGLIGGFVTKALGMFGQFAVQGISRFTGFVTRVAGSIGEWASGLISRATSAMSGFGSAIANGISRVLADFGRFVSGIFQAFASVPGEMANIGRNIVQGIWNGISSLGGWLKSKVFGWAKNVLPGPIADMLGISSPSKLMMEYGVNIAKGLAQGLEGASSLVKNASEQLAALTITTMPSPALVAQAAGTPSTAASSQVVNQNAPLLVIENLYVRNDQDLQNIQQMMRQLYNENARALRAKGVRA